MDLAIILCTKNGEKFLKDQLESIANQTFKEFDLYIKDNNSSDSTFKVIDNFIDNHKDINVFVMKGDNLHYANSYVKLLMDLNKNYKYYAFCDQDDIWDINHLQRGVNSIKFAKVPKLICSRTLLINSNNNTIGMSPYFRKPLKFQNALVQSIAGANTMIFNKKAANLLMNVNYNDHIVSHDWLLYIIITAYDGDINYFSSPSVRYRQHKKNTIGSNLGINNKFKRIKMLLDGTYLSYNLQNITHIEKFKNISKKNEEFFFYYKKAIIEKNIILSASYLIKSNVYRQTFLGNIALKFFILIGRKIN